jgi:hypothetical protein
MSGVYEPARDTNGQTRRDGMAEITLERVQSQRQSAAKEPRLEIEWNKKENQFRVKIATTDYGWFADTAANRKAVFVFLR